MTRGCTKCLHFFMDGEGGELPQFDYADCSEHPWRAYLKSFPFRDTKCKSWEIKDQEKPQ